MNTRNTKIETQVVAIQKLNLNKMQIIRYLITHNRLGKCRSKAIAFIKMFANHKVIISDDDTMSMRFITSQIFCYVTMLEKVHKITDAELT
jgi:hypothetical protein